MKLYVVRLTRLRDRFTQYPAGALDMPYIEDAVKGYIVMLAKATGETLHPKGSRCWKNSKVEVAIESRRAPFTICYNKGEWTERRLEHL